MQAPFGGSSVSTIKQRQLVCPVCEHKWEEDVQGHPIRRELPLTAPPRIF